MNPTAKTYALFALLTLLLMAVGYLLGYIYGAVLPGLFFFLILAFIINWVAYFYSDKIVLWSYRAKIIKEEENPDLFEIVRKVSFNASVPMPKIAIVPLQIPNAFATGRNQKNAVICVTQGLLNTLNREEIEGVIGHEMGHIKDRDTLLMTVSATIAGAFSFMARVYLWRSIFSRDRNNSWLIYVILALAAFAALLIQLAISRQREFKADEQSAKFTKNPLALASALRKIDIAVRRRPFTQGNPSTASLFIVNPFHGKGFITLFSTHPPTEERIRRLEKMAQDYSYL